MAELPPPPEGIVLAHFIVSDDVERSRRFYTEVLGGRVAFSGPGGLTYVARSLAVEYARRGVRVKADQRRRWPPSAGKTRPTAPRSAPGGRLPSGP
jgi:catechol 2,3-dioxygenase-like lactoylglutathione lyase family enzyme